MQTAGLVSVVIPFFDPDESLLREAVASVKAQTYPEWEILLVDDGSTPNVGSAAAHALTASMPERARIVTYDTPGNRGASAARNEGASRSNGKFVAFLDADDVWLPNKLRLEVDALIANPRAGMVCTNTRYWYSWASVDQERPDFVPVFEQSGQYDPPGPIARWLSGASAVPPTSSVTVRRETLEAVGGFEERFPGLYDDQVFYAKVCLEHPVILVDTVTAYYRQHGQSMCATKSVHEERRARRAFVTWLSEYVGTVGMSEPRLLDAIRTEVWKARNPRLASLDRWLRKLARSGTGRAPAARKTSVNGEAAPHDRLRA